MGGQPRISCILGSWRLTIWVQAAGFVAAARGPRVKSSRGAQNQGTAATTAFTRENRHPRPEQGSRPRPVPGRPRTMTPRAITALCAPHSARKPCVSWGRVAASSPFQNVRPVVTRPAKGGRSTSRGEGNGTVKVKPGSSKATLNQHRGRRSQAVHAEAVAKGGARRSPPRRAG